MESTCVVWFRRDLRLDDNPALVYALQNFSQVIPFFVWACEEEGQVRLRATASLFFLAPDACARPACCAPRRMHCAFGRVDSSFYAVARLRAWRGL